VIQNDNISAFPKKLGKACVCSAALLLFLSFGKAHGAHGATVDDPPASTRPAATSPSAEEQKLNAAVVAKLDRNLPNVSFDAVGMADIVDFLQDVSGAKIVVKWETLKAVGIAKNKPITLSLRDVKFADAMSVFLAVAAGKPGVLKYTVENGAIVISAAGSAPATRSS